MEAHEDFPLVSNEVARTDGPDLTVIQGGLAVGETVELVPSVSGMTETEFRDHTHSLLYGGDELSRLLEVDHSLNARSAELNVEVSKMTEELHQIYAKKLWLNGLIRDRR